MRIETIPIRQLFSVRLSGRVYQFTIVPESDITIWVSVQSLLPLPAKTSHIKPLGNITNQPRSILSDSATPILCDRSIYTGTPVARITHHPTKQVVDLYYAGEWLTELKSHTPIIYHHNDRYWVFTDYEPVQAQQYREWGGKWCNRARCWVFRELPVPEIPVFAP